MALCATLTLGLALAAAPGVGPPDAAPAAAPPAASRPASSAPAAPVSAAAPARSATASTVAGPMSPQVTPAPREKCPVCGMIVARFPDWVAGATFADGSRALFDGAKDLFKFLMRFEDYGPQAHRGEPTALYVTDYYSLTQVEARAAHYVVGSDVLGPMGQELVPFARLEDARGFLADHRGARILRFDEVTAAVVRELDREG